MKPKAEDRWKRARWAVACCNVAAGETSQQERGNKGEKGEEVEGFPSSFKSWSSIRMAALLPPLALDSSFLPSSNLSRGLGRNRRWTGLHRPPRTVVSKSIYKDFFCVLFFLFLPKERDRKFVLLDRSCLEDERFMKYMHFPNHDLVGNILQSQIYSDFWRTPSYTPPTHKRRHSWQGLISSETRNSESICSCSVVATLGHHLSTF